MKKKYIPIPIIHVDYDIDYDINARILSACRGLGDPSGTTSVERAVRRIMWKQLDDLLLYQIRLKKDCADPTGIELPEWRWYHFN